ncbi:MAG TPA: crosslink repair DNA glycosylase YcaQ family protein, partial [Gaiellaceae bacterium]|nr:crosslink repair DNA glycosylase YcaQ family protein [Gaiellaceae bacterium]
PEPYRKVIIANNGDVGQTFLVDGLVAGTWRVDKGRVVTEPFGKLSRETKAELAAEAGRLEEFLAD